MKCKSVFECNFETHQTFSGYYGCTQWLHRQYHSKWYCTCLVTLHPGQGQPFLLRGGDLILLLCAPPTQTYALRKQILPYLSIGVLHVSILQQISCSQRYISFPYVTFFLIGTSLVSAILLICNLKTVWHAFKRIQ